MDRLRKFGRHSKRVYNRLTHKDEEHAVDFNFTSHVNAESLTVTWLIENVNYLRMKTGEFYESPPFSIGFYNEFKWAIRLYPRGRNTKEKAGLFVCKLSPNSRTFVEYHLKVELIPVLTRDSKKEQNAVYSHDNYIQAGERRQALESKESENVNLEGWGCDGLFPSDCLVGTKSLEIICSLRVVYMDEEGDVRNYIAGPSRSLCIDFQELYKSGKFSDITLQVGEKREPFPAHKAVLAARSKVFSAMFDHDMKESSSNAVEIQDIEPSTMTSLLQYIYTGKVDGMTMDKAISLFSAADKYSLEELQNLCVGVILAKLSAENVCQIAVLAYMHSVPKLKRATNFIFRTYKHEILQKKEWKKLIRENPQLASDILQAMSFEFTSKISDK